MADVCRDRQALGTDWPSVDLMNSGSVGDPFSGKEMAQQEKSPAAKPDNAGLIPRSHKERTNKERQKGLVLC